MRKSAYSKVVVIGLDGADWALLRPYIDAGQLPTVAKLCAEGGYGRLQSTIRPESSVAWSTFSTGVNAGKHNVYGFVRHKPNSYDFQLANADTIAVRRFWDILGDSGLRSGLINVPFTYPPAPVDGFLISGMLSPGKHLPFTYPPDLQKRVLDRFNNAYLFDAGDNEREAEQLMASVRAYTEQQLKTALWLMDEEEWALLTLIFTGPDRLQHFLWPTEGVGSGEDVLLPYFQELDRAITRLIDKLPSDALVLIMSDHGFNGVGRRFYINRWLEREGLLSLHDNNHRLAGDMLSWTSALKKVPGVRRLKRALLPNDWGPTKLKTAVFTQPINWEQTKVYYALDGGLRINLQGREPQGIVSAGAEYEALRQTLREKLQQLRDPKTNHPPIANVYWREELYNGRYTENAPDIIVEPQRTQTKAQHNYLLDASLTWKGELFVASDPYTGNHAPEGILIAWGKHVQSGIMLNDNHIMDIAPTVLAALGTTVPTYMDGNVIPQILTPEQLDAVIYAEVNTDVAYKSGTLNMEDTTVEARLRNLGYLD